MSSRNAPVHIYTTPPLFVVVGKEEVSNSRIDITTDRFMYTRRLWQWAIQERRQPLVEIWSSFFQLLECSSGVGGSCLIWIEMYIKKGVLLPSTGSSFLYWHVLYQLQSTTSREMYQFVRIESHIDVNTVKNCCAGSMDVEQWTAAPESRSGTVLHSRRLRFIHRADKAYSYCVTAHKKSTIMADI